MWFWMNLFDFHQPGKRNRHFEIFGRANFRLNRLRKRRN